MTENMQVDKRKIEGIYWGPCCEEGYTVGKFGITDIELVMENGQCAAVPWFAVYRDAENCPFVRMNGAHVAQVIYATD